MNTDIKATLLSKKTVIKGSGNFRDPVVGGVCKRTARSVKVLISKIKWRYFSKKFPHSSGPQRVSLRKGT